MRVVHLPITADKLCFDPAYHTPASITFTEEFPSINPVMCAQFKDKAEERAI
jgi:hypothetical protein